MLCGYMHSRRWRVARLMLLHSSAGRHQDVRVLSGRNDLVFWFAISHAFGLLNPRAVVHMPAAFEDQAQGLSFELWICE